MEANRDENLSLEAAATRLSSHLDQRWRDAELAVSWMAGMLSLTDEQFIEELRTSDFSMNNVRCALALVGGEASVRMIQRRKETGDG